MLFWNYSRSKIGQVNPPWCNTSFVISFRQMVWLDPYLVLHNFWLSNILLGSNACQTPCIDSIPHRLLFGSAPCMMTEITQMLFECRLRQRPLHEGWRKQQEKGKKCHGFARQETNDGPLLEKTVQERFHDHMYVYSYVLNWVARGRKTFLLRVTTATHSVYRRQDVFMCIHWKYHRYIW